MYTLCNAFSLSMIPDARYATITVTERTAAAAGGLVTRSAIGHADTARIVAEQIGRPDLAEPARVMARLPVVVAQYTGPRLPEGATTLPEGAEIRYYTVEVTS